VRVTYEVEAATTAFETAKTKAKARTKAKALFRAAEEAKRFASAAKRGQ
jgi:translation elongation factor P/translation initiation factor 5A